MTIDLQKINYLTFEGGGGKGLVYLGAIRALEQKFSLSNQKARVESRLPGKDRPNNPSNYGDPLFPIFETTPVHRQLKGVSGASAGAITAFLLAMGLSSKELDDELAESGRLFFHNKFNTVSIFETFYEDPRPFDYRLVSDSNIGFSSRPSLMRDKILAISDWVKKLVPGLILSGIEKPHPTIKKKILYSNATVLPRKLTSARMLGDYIVSLLFNRGIFPGFEVRKYFENLMKKYLHKRFEKLGLKFFENKPPAKVTFADFFNATGVDLVISGVNVTQKLSLLFSYSQTPDFPVIEAVGISMNIPIVFKPVIVDMIVKQSGSEAHNLKYVGAWVDGGMLNNLPLHAFDKLKKNSVKYWNGLETHSLSDIAVGNESLNPNVVGFRLAKGNHGLLSSASIEEELEFQDYASAIKAAKANNYSPTEGYMGELLGTFLKSSSSSQTRTEKEKEQVILLDSQGIDTLDFTAPNMNIERGETKVAKNKIRLTDLAEETVLELIQ